MEGIPEVDEQQTRELWEAVHRNAVENWSDDNVSPPFSEMNLGPPVWDEVDPKVSKDEILSLESQPSQQSDPSDLGKYIDRAATLYVPSMRNQGVQEKEGANLEAII